MSKLSAFPTESAHAHTAELPRRTVQTRVRSGGQGSDWYGNALLVKQDGAVDTVGSEPA